MHPLLAETKATHMFQQMTYMDAYINLFPWHIVYTMQKWQSAEITVLIGR